MADAFLRKNLNTPDTKTQPIGVFDSGVGGLTVVRQLRNLMPNESILYLGDTARVPYGSKSPKTVTRFACEDAKFLIKRKVKAIVVACNTASSCALPALTAAFQVPIFGVIEPGASAALSVSRSKRIGVIATPATIRSKAYTHAIHKLSPDAQVFPHPCPLLVPLVEEVWFTHPATLLILEEYLTPLVCNQIDTLILGCTHYPLLKKAIRMTLLKLAPNATTIDIVDSAESCAAHVRDQLTQLNLQSTSPTVGNIKAFVTDEPKNFIRTANAFLGFEPEQTNLVELSPL